MAKIRHEFNMLNTSISSGGTSYNYIYINQSLYNGTLTVYFEVYVSVAAASTTATLNNTYSGISATINTTAVGLQRVSATLASNGGISYTYFVNTTGAGATITSARAIVIQDTGSEPLTSCETAIEIGSHSSVTAITIPTGATASNQTNPKYWYYDSAKWDGSCAFYFEAAFASPSTKSASTVQLQVADGTGDGFTGWSNVTNGALTTTGTGGGARVRASSPFTPVSGRWYRIVSSSPASKSAMTVYGAKIIVQQTAAGFTSFTTANQWPNIGAGNRSLGETFAGSASSLKHAVFMIQRFGTPVGTVTANLYAHTGTFGSSGLPTGSPLATSDAVNAATIQTGSASGYAVFTFSSPYTLSAGTNYVIAVTLNCSTYDGSNYLQFAENSSGASYAGNGVFHNGTSWSVPSYDVCFMLLTQGITKLQPQYLMSNTVLAAGTSLQSFLQTFDPAEWSGVTNTYRLQAEAANNTSSAVQLRTSNDVTELALGYRPDNAMIFGGESIVNAPFSGTGGAEEFGAAGPNSFRIAQAFTPSRNLSVGGIWPGVSKSGGPTDSMVIEICALYSSASALGSISVLYTAIVTSVSPALYKFSPSVSLTSGTTYYVRLSRSGAANSSDNYNNGLNTTGLFGSNYWYEQENDRVWRQAASATNLAMAIIAESINMPSSTTNMDVKATTNNNDLYAVRILVDVVVTTVATAVQRAWAVING